MLFHQPTQAANSRKKKKKSYGGGAVIGTRDDPKTKHVFPYMVTHHILFSILSSPVIDDLDHDLSDLSGGAYVIGNHNARWTQKHVFPYVYTP